MDNQKFDYQKKSTHLTFCSYSKNNFNNDIFYKLGKISKNIYNITIYSIQVFNTFKIELYKNLYNELIINNEMDISKYINKKLLEYYEIYSSIKTKINNNNNIIYKYIINDINTNNIIVKNNNYNILLNKYLFELKNHNQIYFDDNHIDILYNSIIIRIINSIYIKNYKKTENEMLNHISYTIYDEDIINDIKNKNIKNFKINNIYKKKIIDEFDTKVNKMTSDQNYIGRLVQATLGNNYGMLDSTMVGSIINKSYQSYTSYYAVLNKDLKANVPKFLKKDSIYNLIYNYDKAIKKDNNIIKLYTSTYIAKNFSNIYKDYIKVNNNKYIKKKFLKNYDKKILKKDNYIIGEKYIEKNNKHIIDSRYIEIYLPKKIIDKNIKEIEIAFHNDSVKICYSYINDNKNKEKSIEINNNESISIDMGMKNLLTIYNPTGEQNIIDGKFISSINRHYIKKIGDSQRDNNQTLFYKNIKKRANIINNYFNLIVKWMEKKFFDKKLIIIGYNKEWKTGVNMGKTNNREFYKIPYMQLINKIKNKFTNLNKIVILTEESYTSKCDALALEKICKHENYQGKRIKRGLFESSEGKLINADINGAINIMRKVFKNINEITGIRIENPKRIKIFRESSRPADKTL